VSASASIGFEGVSVGGDVKLVKAGESKVAPKSYNAGIAYTNKNYTGAIVSDSKFEKLKLTLLASKLTADKVHTRTQRRSHASQLRPSGSVDPFRSCHQDRMRQ